ncbi:MAG: hypothetical protein JXN60_08860 [Lentisphaerae bacterium]|nr:hypothetical protein [Lentisphaerota bacterium]
MNEEEIAHLAREQQDKFLSQFVTALSAYWSALLTSNGLLLSALSIVLVIRASLTPSWQGKLIVSALFLNLLAMLALLWCFRSERAHYNRAPQDGAHTILA